MCGTLANCRATRRNAICSVVSVRLVTSKSKTPSSSIHPRMRPFPGICRRTTRKKLRISGNRRTPRVRARPFVNSWRLQRRQQRLRLLLPASRHGSRSAGIENWSPARKPEYEAFLFDFDVFSERVRADVGGVDGALVVGDDAGGAGDAVHVSLRKVGIGDEGRERAVFGATNRDAPQEARVDGGVRLRVAYVQRVVFRNIDGTRAAELRPRSDEFSVLVENLHAAVTSVCNVHMPFGAADGDVVRLVELTWA